MSKKINKTYGYPKLVEAVLTKYSTIIQNEEQFTRLFRREPTHLEWLLKQKRWVKEDKFWFSAYDTYFEYEESKMKAGFTNLINNALEKYEY